MSVWGLLVANVCYRVMEWWGRPKVDYVRPREYDGEYS